VLEFRDIRKSFGAVQALSGVSFTVAQGEAHAVVGENGAGKSTLLKMLAGIVRPDAGELWWQGRRLDVASPHEAIARGVGMVYQEMLCFPNLTVAGNIFAGRELTSFGRLRDAEMRAHTRRLLDRLSFRVDPDALAESLSAAHRQLLQVARALAHDCRILVLDEPTTALTDSEADHLFDVLRDIKAQGTTLLYVSHRLPEVFRLCDRITVLRDGGYVGTFDCPQVEPARVVRAMVGRDLPERTRGAGDATTVEASSTSARPPRLEAIRLSRAPFVHDVSLAVAAGEIVALFGLVGSGRTELLETIFGLHRPTAGGIRLDGVAATPASARDAARRGLALVPEERQRQGLLFNLGVRDNLLIPRQTIRRATLVRRADERATADALVRGWRIKAPDTEVTPDRLSGGNQQKVVLAKWLATEPNVLLLDEPTKGVDVGAKFEIHELVRREAARGMAVLVASSDLPEVLALADRIVVMREGRVQGELGGVGATEEAVMRLATAESVPA
jgi:ABC-type sugar transport system ATPase subunit